MDFCAVAAAGAVVDQQEVRVSVVQHGELGPASMEKHKCLD